MAPLLLILMFVLQFEGVHGDTVNLYHRPGHNAVLPCRRLSSAPSMCATISWFHNTAATQVVSGGIVKSDPVRAARLNVETDCSLFINSITAEDAGRYVCRKGGDNKLDTSVFLYILTISPSPPGGSEVTLKCSVLGHHDCGEKRLRWVDEAGTELRGEDPVGGCVSLLTVNSGHGRRFTCQLVDKSNDTKVQIQADFTLVVTDPPYIAIGTVGGVVVFLLVVVVVAAVLIKCRKRTKETGAERPTHPHDEENKENKENKENDVTYATVSYVNQRASAVKQVKEEENVTYSTIKTPVNDRSMVCQRAKINQRI